MFLAWNKIFLLVDLRSPLLMRTMRSICNHKPLNSKKSKVLVWNSLSRVRIYSKWHRKSHFAVKIALERIWEVRMHPHTLTVLNWCIFLSCSLGWFLLVPRRTLGQRGSQWWLSVRIFWVLPSGNAPLSLTTKCKLETTPCTTPLPASGSTDNRFGKDLEGEFSQFAIKVEVFFIFWFGEIYLSMGSLSVATGDLPHGERELNESRSAVYSNPWYYFSSPLCFLVILILPLKSKYLICVTEQLS